MMPRADAISPPSGLRAIHENEHADSWPVSSTRPGPSGSPKVYTANATSSLTPQPTPYKSQHFSDYPLSAADVAQAEAESEAAASLDYAAQQRRMLSDQLRQSEIDGHEADYEDPASRVDGDLGSGGRMPHASLELEEADESEIVYSFPWRSAIVALILLCVGITCLVLGIVHFATGKGGSFAFVIIGAILIIPGSYQSYIIYHAWRRVSSRDSHG